MEGGLSLLKAMDAQEEQAEDKAQTGLSSMRQPIKISSRVPAYQNGRKPSVSAVFYVASSPCRERP
jgi:hypothetical protein